MKDNLKIYQIKSSDRWLGLMQPPEVIRFRQLGNKLRTLLFLEKKTNLPPPLPVSIHPTCSVLPTHQIIDAFAAMGDKEREKEKEKETRTPAPTSNHRSKRQPAVAE